MKYKSTRIIFFSPTHTSGRIAMSIARGIGNTETETTDLTFDDSHAVLNVENQIAVISVPVYRGRVAPLAMERLMRLKGNATPAVLAVTYGNRDYEDALLELKDAAESMGFITVSAGAFIGEHSYSRPSMPVAAGRPDQSDLEKAESFGKGSAEKLRSAGSAAALPELEVKGCRPYKDVPPGNTVPVPECSGGCTLCGHCIEVCPGHAISLNGDRSALLTDSGRCICCCACVKYCPSGARFYDTPVTAYLYRNFSSRREPEIFL